MKKVLKIFFGIVVLIIFVWTIIFLYNKSKSKPVVFETKSPTKLTIVKKTVATGSVVPRKEIEIKPQVSGIIQELYVIAGKTIKKGDLIAKVKIIPNMVEMNNAESRLNRAKLSLEDAEIVFKRQKQLFEKGVIAEAEFLQNQLQYNNSKEEFNAAQNHLDLIREGVTKNSGQATNTLIKSTIEGMVLEVPIEVGNSVIEANTFNAGTTVATVADMGEMIFKGKVDETEVGKIHVNMPLNLSIGAIENETFDANLEYIAPKGVLENGAIQFEIKAAVKLKAGQFIRAGYSANANIVLAQKDSVLSIEESLLQFEGEKSFVEIETSPQKFEKRYLKTGLSDGIHIEIVEGLKITDKIKVFTLVTKPQ